MRWHRSWACRTRKKGFKVLANATLEEGLGYCHMCHFAGLPDGWHRSWTCTARSGGFRALAHAPCEEGPRTAPPRYWLMPLQPQLSSVASFTWSRRGFGCWLMHPERGASGLVHESHRPYISRFFKISKLALYLRLGNVSQVHSVRCTIAILPCWVDNHREIPDFFPPGKPHAMQQRQRPKLVRWQAQCIAKW